LSGQITGDLTSVKAAEIQSQQSAHVKYHYVVESELTEAEKSALIREIPKHVEDASETYYLVYRPTTQGDSSGVLPKTGHSGLWESTFTAMGLALLVQKWEEVFIFYLVGNWNGIHTAISNSLSSDEYRARCI